MSFTFREMEVGAQRHPELESPSDRWKHFRPEDTIRILSGGKSSEISFGLLEGCRQRRLFDSRRLHQTSLQTSGLKSEATSRHAIIKSEVFSSPKRLGVGGCRAVAISEGGQVSSSFPIN